jgi:general secretion pathway protein I
MTRDRKAGGFTLIEVMIALAILAGGLVFLMRSTASNIYAAQKAQMLTAATNLARGKMYELEELLASEGFQELDQIEEGNFSEEGWPAITWKAETIKIELPDMASLQAVSGEGQEGATGQTGAAQPGGLLGGIMGGMGGLGGDPSSAAGAGIMSSYYSLIADVLKDAIRKVTLTVTYPVVGGGTESFVVTCYFTDPAAVKRKVPVTGGDEADDQPPGQQPPGQQPPGQQPPGQQPPGQQPPGRSPRGSER